MRQTKIHHRNQNQSRIHAGKNYFGRRSLLLLAAGTAGISLLSGYGTRRVQAQTALYFDGNGASSGLGTSGTWNSSSKVWTTDSTGSSATQTWSPGAVAIFGNTANVTLQDSETITGINLSSGVLTLGTTVGNTSAVLNIGSNNITINNAVNATNQDILVPFVGSGNITYNYTQNAVNGTDTLNISGAMSGFSGNLYVNPGFSATNLAIVALDSSLGTANGSSPSTSTIYLGNYSLIGNENPFQTTTAVNGTYIAVSTATTFTNYSNISTGYLYTGSGLANAWVSSSNGGTIGGVATQKIETYAGVISGPSNITFGIGNSGGRGTVILGASNTYTGNTYITLANTNGLLQLGVDNAIPSTSTLTFGPNPAFNTGSGSGVAPFDLNGHNLTIAGLATNSAVTTAAGVGNIYNTNGANTSTLTITGSANTTYGGDIGDTSASVNPFNDMAPYYTNGHTNVVPSTNIALTINGPGTLTLKPVSGLANGNEFTGQTTVNGGGLTLGRTTAVVTAGQVGANYTLQNSNIVVNSGATLSTVYSPNTSYVGGTGGSITLNNGSIFNPGGTGGTNNTAVVASNSLILNGGATLNFDVNSLTAYDQLILAGGVTLNSGTNTVNISTTNAQLPGGDYPLIEANGGGFSGPGTFVAGALPASTNGTTYSIGPDPSNSNYLDLIVQSPTLQWDPSGNGAPVTDGPGNWSTGSPFLNLQTNSETSWTNTSPDNVIIGNNITGLGGTITLGSNIVVNGALTFGPIELYNGQGYNVANSGSAAYSLTTTDGITANSVAEIDTPVTLAQSQNWSVDSGQTLTVTGTLNQSSPSTLTATGPGTIILSGSGGSISGLQINAGTVALEAVDAVGTAAINISGGTLGLGVSTTFTNPISFGATASIGPYNGTTPTIAENLNSSGNVTVTTSGTGGGTLTLTGTNTFGSLTLAGGVTLLVPSSASLGTGPINFSSGGLNAAPLTALTNNITLKTSGTNGNANVLTIGPTLSYSGSISGSGDLHLQGSTGTLTLSGSSNFSGGALYIDAPLTLTVTNPAGLSTGTVAVNAAATLDIETNVNAGPIRGSGTWNKTGPGTLSLSGSTSADPQSGLGVILQQGNIELNSVTGLGGRNTTVATSAPQASITINPNAQLLINTSGQRASGNITLAGGSIVRLPTTPTGDFAFTILSADVGASTSFVYSVNNSTPVLTVTASSLIENQQQAIVGVSNDLMITEPVVVNSGTKLTLQSDNTAGNYEQAAIILRGTTNNTLEPYESLTLQAGSTVQATGPGDVDFGGTGRGEPIIAEGTPGADAVLQLGSHSLLRDQGAATQNQGTTDTTRLVIAGAGTAGLRIEAPMNATYAVPNPSGAPTVQPYEGTTGIFGNNSTGTYTSSTTPTGYTTIGNDFTILSPNRAAELSNTYNTASGTTIVPQGTLTLAPTDAAGATGVVNAGPALPSGVSLALDNTAGSGNLVYQIDPNANGGTFANFAGLTVERSFNSAGSVSAQLLGNTIVPSLTLSGGATLDVSSHDLVVTHGSFSTINSQVSASFNSGRWNGSGVISSSAAAGDTSHLTALGVISNDDGSGNPLYGSGTALGLFGGLNPAVDAVLVKYTYYGDANLDGKVDGSDYSRIDNGYENQLTGWYNGDFNYDGVINGSDYTLIDNAFNTQGASLADEIDGSLLAVPTAEISGSASVSAVPEPATLGLLSFGSLALLGRRRRRCH